MSERLHHHHEQIPEQQEQMAETPEQQRALKETIERGKYAEHEAQKSIESIKHNVEQQAVSGKEIAAQEHTAESSENNHYAITRSVKKAALKKQLAHTRRKLSIPERTLSRIIHQPVVDRVSTIAGNTVARPSGILFGGIGALIGSIILYYLSKHYGFNYNFLAYAFLFTACYIAGVVGEYILRSLRKLGRKH